MLTLESLIYETAEALSQAKLCFAHGTDNALDEAAWLVLHGVGLSPVEPIENPKQVISVQQAEKVSQLLAARISTRKPLAYLTGSAWFCGYEFYVDERVLVPRSPIAEMIEHGFSPWLRQEPAVILDLCCGSACIAIACAHYFEQAQIHASDISSDALLVAEKNIARYELHPRVKLFESDIFQALPAQRYDLIVSNPPYVDQLDMSLLSDEFKNEPELGLAAGGDGLLIVRQILKYALDFLSESGLLVVEVGNSAEHVMIAYPNIPFTWVEFSRGGDGVFVLTVDELKQYRQFL